MLMVKMTYISIKSTLGCHSRILVEVARLLGNVLLVEMRGFAPLSRTPLDQLHTIILLYIPL
jgi:hypothetical protein